MNYVTGTYQDQAERDVVHAAKLNKDGTSRTYSASFRRSPVGAALKAKYINMAERTGFAITEEVGMPVLMQAQAV